MLDPRPTITIDQLSERLEALDRLTDARLRADAEKVQMALVAAEKAIMKAEAATEKRFDCVTADTPILCADLVWRPAGTLAVDDELIAFDEESGARSGRRFRRAVVTANSIEHDALLKVVTESGVIRCNHQHPWLTLKLGGSTSWQWVNAADLRPGDKVKRVLDVWQDDNSWDAGWLAGMYDGEGCLMLDKNGRVQLSVTQRKSLTADRLGEALTSRLSSVCIYETAKAHLGWSDRMDFIVTRRSEVLKLLGSVRPPRLLDMADKAWDGLVLGGNDQQVVVESVEEDGEGEIASLSTSTRTYIAGGFAMHNSVNEFRSALTDQAATFVTREVFEQVFATSQADRVSLHQSIEDLRLALAGNITRIELRTMVDTHEKVHEALRLNVEELRNSQTRMVGIAVGLSAAITLISTLTAVIVRLAG